MSQVKELGWPAAPLTDRMSTFGFTRWAAACEKNSMKPLFGVEIPCVTELGERRPTTDQWTFFAKNSLRPLHELIRKATNNPGKEPVLLYQQALAQEGVFVLAGERLLVDKLPPALPQPWLALAPSTPKGLINRARAAGLSFVASSDNYYTRPEDREFYRVALNRRAGTQTYPMHIMDDDELRNYLIEDMEVDLDLVAQAFDNRNMIMDACNAKQQKAKLLVPDKPMSLRAMCEAAAVERGVDLTDPIYADRLASELELISDKNYEDYFYILSDMVTWAKQRMVVGPARGSSCGSLVCYLLNITAIDPIPYGLLFSRFLDPNRFDLPDIDIDFSDVHRDKVFEYAEKKYGRDRVARLGTVGMFKARSALNQVGISLQMPKWEIDKLADSIIERSSGDSRVNNSLEDTLDTTDQGRALVKKYPEVRMACRMEGHPQLSSQHAAGLLLTAEPMTEYVAVDARSGAAWCDKKDSEDLNLLKIDALGLTQLSIFERTLELIGEKPISGWLEKIPLDDPAAFEVLNQKRWSGVFQVTGTAVRALAGQIHFERLDDLVALGAIGRPGPLASGGAMNWIRRRAGEEYEKAKHPLLEALTAETYGVVVYQETVMRITREIGQFSWADTAKIRKLMSARMGDEAFAAWWDKFRDGAVANGMPEIEAKELWEQINSFGSWCLAGDTVLDNPHPNQYAPNKTYTLRELYDRKGFAPGWETNSGRRQKLFMWDGLGLKPAANVAVVYSGKKPTWAVVSESGLCIRSTLEHKFLTPSGYYVKLDDLSVGDEIMAKGGSQLTSRKAKTNTGSGRHNWRNTEIEGGEFFNGKRGNRLKVLERDRVCTRCRVKSVQEVHHKNMDHYDHRMENLAGVCRKCHKAYHREAGVVPVPFQKGFGIVPDKIKSITYHGIEDVYDISMPDPHNNFLANGLVVHNSFNKSHAVAYGIISYWCCWLKAHHPLEFAAATLDAEGDANKQLALLRELDAEGVTYVPVDPEHSTDRWSIAPDPSDPTKQRLVGPLTAIKGIGPAKVREVLDARKSGNPVRPVILKQLTNARTEIDSLYPIADRVKALHPDLTAINIISKPERVIDVQVNGREHEVMIFAKVVKISPRSENEEVNIAKRGGRRVSGPDQSINTFWQDDSDEIFVKVDRYDYERLGVPFLQQAKTGKSLYAIKGTCPRGFRMIRVKQMRYLGEME